MVKVESGLCSYCGGCVSLCPQKALSLAETRVVVGEACNDCGLCVRVCPSGALSIPRATSRAVHPSPDSSYDVVVIGAGPAGSMAALYAARHGASVLLLEKRQEIGSPVRCAEGISAEALRRFFEPMPSFVASTITGAAFYFQDGKTFKLWKSFQAGEGFILERRIFDRFLAEEAARAGAKVLVKTPAVGLLMDGGRIRGVRVKAAGVEKEVEAKVVIAADGVESEAGRWAGINTTLPPKEAISCAQFLLSGIEVDPSITLYYLTPEFAPGGYAWVFPKGEGKANVGLGVQANLAREPAINYLVRFIESIPALSKGSPVTLITGLVPLRPLETIVGPGIILVGDAAGQVDPLTGGGIPFAMAAGALAGEVAARFAQGESPLEEYRERWEEKWGRKLRRNYNLKEQFPPEVRTGESFLRLFAAATGSVK
ncbi:MAG: geranylgeranyl reductase family protein [Anaerolineae bacterium]|nr:geranylgeranyl reductase family protein [Anaerolineae bacterium]MDW8102618.1 geranylgeranyl reductase family protein [Anaerolineae bacterium]